MAQISESLEALRKEAPARFLESDQFQEMRKTYEKLKPLADTKPKSFAKQCSEYDFQRIYPVMDAFLSAHDLSTPDKLSALVEAASPELPEGWVWADRAALERDYAVPNAFQAFAGAVEARL